jgi:hypothetical protein
MDSEDGDKHLVVGKGWSGNQWIKNEECHILNGDGNVGKRISSVLGLHAEVLLSAPIFRYHAPWKPTLSDSLIYT